jgi:transposase-like protein
VITGKTMCRWVNEYRHDGNDAFPGKEHLKPEDAELRRLKYENEELKDDKYLPFIRMEFNKSSQTYGLRRLSKVLKQTYELNIGRTRVRNIMAENNMVPKTIKEI